MRRQFLPDGERHRNFACSALDLRWMDEVDSSRGVFITAAGLLYYFNEPEVAHLISSCARRFSGGEMMFDTIPRWMSARSVRGGGLKKGSYRAPSMPWGIDPNETARVRAFDKEIADVREVNFPNGRGLFFGVIAPALENLPLLRNKRPTMMVARFGLR